MPNTRWSKSERDEIGRPVNAWDTCPHCRQPVKNHFYDRPTEDLVCPVYTAEQLEEIRKARRDFVDEARIDSDLMTKKIRDAWEGKADYDRRQAERKQRALARRQERKQQEEPITSGRRRYFSE